MRGRKVTDTERERTQKLLKIARQNEKQHKDTIWVLPICTGLVLVAIFSAYLAILSAVDVAP